MEIKDFLRDICEAPGVSGYEHNVAKIVNAAFLDYADEVRQDRLGNVVFYKKGTGENRPRILLAAHMDEIGLMVTKVEEGGFLRFSAVGGIDPRTIVGQEVILYGKEALPGVIGVKPPHLTAGEDLTKAHSMEDLHIDVALPEERVKKLVSVGDLAVIRREMIDLAGNSVAAKAMDDRAGIAVLLTCLQELERLQHKADVFAVATVQEEVGVRGAATATYGVVPDIGIAVDVTHGEMPGVPEHETSKLGKGPALTLGPNIHPKVGNELISIAKEYKIPYQLEVSPAPTGTDARAIQVTRGGIPTGLVSIPLRYMHTSVELLDLEDVKLSGRLLAYFIAAVDAAFLEGLKCS
ncbi:M42 family metallopeptidase [Dethiobacter alkaliphilus]|uniref:M42 family metallopeptidase n=1 Tax=Dethiobacter alkaliphilus TaxID=427926 RepID=UPI00222608A0|nr:M42 family metallopeptidase [Dethiobacter alkaliphilus]MCW3489972.1 M42 family metallopeptidase [Dethiobacter alkaliphilus]